MGRLRRMPVDDADTVDGFHGNLLAFFNGTFLESFDALVTSNGTTVTMTLAKSGGGDLTTVFSSGQSFFDVSLNGSIVLTPGTDVIPQDNYVYILQTAPNTLVKSTSDWPVAEHIKVAFSSVPSASLVNTGASGNNFVYANQNWNDHAQDTNTGQGHMTHLSERVRRLEAAWHSGAAGTATQDGNDLWVSISTGTVYQLHLHTFEALDSDTAGLGDPILIPNDPDANYAIINSLNEITKLSDGVALGNNKYIKFVLWAVANKTGEVELMMVNLPAGQYNTTSDAKIDVEGHSNFTIPAAFDLESSTGFLIAAFVCKHTATAMEIQETIDLRGQVPTTASGSGSGGGDVSALAAIPDNAVVRGDGGAKDVQGSSASIADNGVMSAPGIGDGGLTNYDLNVGDVTTPSYGMIRFGNAVIGRTSYNVGAIDLNGAVMLRNIGGPVTSEIEFIWTESAGNTCRFALPRSAVGNATYNSRSMLLAGPAPADTDFVKVTYWQGQGIFHNLACDTAGDGADLGVQNDLEVEGDIFVDNIEESTTGVGVTIDSVLLQDGLVDGRDVSTDGTKLDGVESGATADQDLDEIGNPSGNTALSMGTNLLAFNYTAPTAGPGDAPFQIKATGAFAPVLVEIRQLTGNPGASVLLNLAASDADVKPLQISGAHANSIECDKTIKTSLATGTKPLNIASTTLCDNLNADLLDGSHASAFAASAHLHDGDTLELDGIDSDGGGFSFSTGGFAVSFDAALDGITRLDVDNIRIDGNTLSSTDTNGDILISPDGTGVAKLGNVGDTAIGDGTLRTTFPQTDLKVDLGDVTHRFNETHTKFLVLAILADATRGAAGTKGRVIFNDDDGQLNIDDGTNWTLPDGTAT